MLLTVCGQVVSAVLPADSVPPAIGFEVSVNPGKVLSMDSYEKQWLKTSGTCSAEASVVYRPAVDGYARDYNLPSFTVGMRISWNHATTMHRSESPDWGLLEPVDYDSQLGNVVTAFAAFNRPLLRSRRWLAEYQLGMGVGYSHSKYNTLDAIDNELIGARWNIYFKAGLSMTYKVSDELGVKGGVDFSHHSNGAMNRPNKGTNTLGPVLGLVFFPQGDVLGNRRKASSSTSCNYGEQGDDSDWRRGLYGELVLGVGGKTLAEDWQLTQFGTAPGQPDYRTDRFHFYMAYSMQADVMYRYARRWASGAGVDVFYGTYSDHVAAMDAAAGVQERHSPWSVALAAKHEVFYGRLSVRMGVGVYLYRKMGSVARELEQPYYERIGVHYAFPRLGGLSVGLNVNAHRTKADFTELQLTVPIRF